ncbi:hypothetical protein [Marinobacter shengliensis]|uniref:hypothetical protein n=1 Tax=Marinobacter shengliensis TaxID=1389223 RepID=UPI00110849EE|nr:hypothetical protein [Marinobacter shengliensis]
MSLNYWQNPHKPTMERLYVDSRVLHLWEGVDRDTVKIWIEPSETMLAGWVIKAKGDVSAIGRGLRFQQAVMDALRISQSQSWSDLMQLAEFGSVRKVMSATETELRAVEGLGPRKVKALMSVLGEAI